MTKINQLFFRLSRICFAILCASVFFTLTVMSVEAATLSVSPGTGVYQTGTTFTVRVNVNTQGKSINAAEGTLRFNPSELSVVSVNRNGSIFNLWVTEPTFSNSAGTINFSGGVPAGFTGGSGNIMTVTFRALGSGESRVSFGAGSVLANDGAGTNVLGSMGGGTFTINAAASTPQAEQVVVEYVAPANTPGAPRVTSRTHADQNAWHTATEAVLDWDIPSGVTGVRTLLNRTPSSVPTRVYESPIRTITLSDLDEGVSYFHIQFRNADGWGRVTSYRLAVDSEKPSEITIERAEGTDENDPEQKLSVAVVDAASEVRRLRVQINDSEPFEFTKESDDSVLPLPALGPGYHTVVIEAFDEAGNSIIGTYTFDIDAFESPVFTEFPTEINEQVIPVIKGTTRALATVQVTLRRVGAEPATYSVTADENGTFTFIPEGRFSTGVYELTARATDQFGAQSLESDVIRIAVQQSGMLRFGSFLVSILSVFIPLIVLVIFSITGSWYLIAYMRRFKKNLQKESGEALVMLRREFEGLQVVLKDQEAKIAASRKTKKLTAAEAAMIAVLSEALRDSELRVQKEISDVTTLTE